MAVIPGQLEKAQLENLAADPSNLPEGRVWANTTSDRAKVVLNGSPQVFVTEAQAQSLTGKSIDADQNTITNIDNADIKAGAAIDATKIANGSVSNTEFQFLDGVTSAIQTQINAKADSSALTTHTGASSGVHGVVGSVVGTSDSQVLSNKTYQNAIISLDQVSLNQTDLATAATITAANTSKPVVRFTGSTATEVQGIDAAGTNKVVTYHNASSALIIFKNQNAGATATNRIITPTGNDLTVRANESVQFIYDATQTRWVIGAGSGSGGSATAYGTFASPRTIASTGFTAALGHMSTTDANQVVFVASASGEVDVTANPQVQAGTQVGQVMRIIGTSSANYIKLEDGNGLSLNGDWYSLANANISLLWDGVKWTEMGRRDA